jgi:hypothetical protein
MENPMRLTAFACLMILAACVRTIDTPAVTEFTDNSVKLQGAGLSAGDAPLPEHTAKAQELCATKGKNAQFGSSRVVGQIRLEYFFLCI